MEDIVQKSIPINFILEKFSILSIKVMITANTGFNPTMRLIVTAEPRSKEVYTNTDPKAQPTKPARSKYFTEDFLEKESFKSATRLPARNNARLLIRTKRKIFTAE